MSETPRELAGEALHRLIQIQWGGYVPMGTGDYLGHEDGWSSLSDGAMEGWEQIAQRFIAWYEGTRTDGAAG